MYETIVETAPVGLFTLDEDGTITWANQVYADTLDVPREELVGTPFVDLIDAGYYEEAVVERYLDAVRDLLSAGHDVERRNFLVRTHLPDGETLVHDVYVALLPLEDGEFRGTVIAFRDVTKRQAYERELERQNERLETFTSVVSHDLRNPMNVAQAYLERALETDDRDALEEVARALERMDRLVENLLSLAREGESVRDPEPVDVESVARRAWESVGTGDAELDVADGLGTVDGDPDRLQQAFENLFRNSVEHGPDPGRGDAGDLTVTVGPLEDETGLFVADDGTGIPPDARELVFERGYSDAQGTGFGLAIVENVVEAHGWSIEAVDADGARFEITTAGPGVP